jgi:hypothetical protein
MLKIRAHHLLCIPRYYSGGYNKEFGKRHMQVNKSLRKNPNQKVKIIRDLDVLCEKCPYKKGRICQCPIENARILRLDDRVIKRLKLKKNSIHVAKDIFNLSMNKVPTIKGICNICENYKWCLKGKRKGGVNNSFRKNLNK